MRTDRLAAAAALALAACYAPSFEDGLPCSASLQCPDGQRCDTTASPPVCRAGGGPTPDAPDAPPGVDSDGDGVDDGADNCDTIANANQRDHDADGHGDVCDNCPGVANPTQANTGEAPPDGVGDACDPWPGERDRVALFDGFDDPLSAVWRIRGTASVIDGYLVPDPADPFGDSSITHADSFASAARIAIELGAEIDAVDTMTLYPSVKTVLELRPNGVQTDAYECGMSVDTTAMGNPRAADLHVVIADDYMFLDGASIPSDSGRLLVRHAFVRPVAAMGGRPTCRVATPSAAADLSASNSLLSVGPPGFYAYRARARFDHVVIYVGDGAMD